MILADTSIWIEHFRAGQAAFATLLTDGLVRVHPFVIGELACGNLRNRREVLSLLGGLPATRMATDTEALYFIESHHLMGRGIGYVDAHLLAAVALTPPARIWTGDRRLAQVATELGLAY